MEESDKKPQFVMKITMDDKGQIKTRTRQEGIPYPLVISALSHQLYLYNKLWSEQASFTLSEKKQ